MGKHTDEAAKSVAYIGSLEPATTISHADWMDMARTVRRASEAHKAFNEGDTKKYRAILMGGIKGLSGIEKYIFEAFEQLHAAVILYKMTRHAMSDLAVLGAPEETRQDYAVAHQMKDGATDALIMRFGDALINLAQRTSASVFDEYGAKAEQKHSTRDEVVDLIKKVLSGVATKGRKIEQFHFAAQGQEERLAAILEHKCGSTPECPSCATMKQWARGEVPLSTFVNVVFREEGSDPGNLVDYLSTWVINMMGVHDCNVENFNAALKPYGFEAVKMEQDGTIGFETGPIEDEAERAAKMEVEKGGPASDEANEKARAEGQQIPREQAERKTYPHGTYPDGDNLRGLE